jgi:hypothetical protein
MEILPIISKSLSPAIAVFVLYFLLYSVMFSAFTFQRCEIERIRAVIAAKSRQGYSVISPNKPPKHQVIEICGWLIYYSFGV